MHFQPEVFPSSLVWLNGTLTLHQLAEEHPLECELLLALGRLLPPVAAAVTPGEHRTTAAAGPGRFANSKPLIVAELVLYTLLVGFLAVAFVQQLLA